MVDAPRAGESARFPGRLPLPRGQGKASLRRKGPVAQEADRHVLRAGAEGAKTEALLRVLPRDRDDRHAHRARGPAPREHPHQEAPSPVQHLPPGRQDLSLHQDHDGGGLAAGPRDPAGPGRRALLLRALLGGPGAADHAHDHAALPDPDLHARDRRQAAAALPLLRPARLPRSLRRRPDDPGGLRGGRRRRRPLPAGPQPRSSMRGSTRKMQAASEEENFEMAAAYRDAAANGARRGRAPGRPVAARARTSTSSASSSRARTSPSCVLVVRGGVLQDRRDFFFEKSQEIEPGRLSRGVPAAVLRRQPLSAVARCTSRSRSPGRVFSRTSWRRAAARR